MDSDVGLIELELDTLEFDVSVVAEGDIEGDEGDGVVDEESHSSSASPPILVDEGVARDGWKARSVVEFCFLDCCYADAMKVEKVAKLVDFSLDPVTVPL